MYCFVAVNINSYSLYKCHNIYLFFIQQLSTERTNRNKEQLDLQETINNLQQNVQTEQHAAERMTFNIGMLRSCFKPLMLLIYFS